MNDRFDFEQTLLECWRVTDDLNSVSKDVIENEPSLDKINNTLTGLVNLYEIKFNNLWNIFENVMVELSQRNKMLEEECAALRNQLTEKEKE
jgi:hypothetical protein